MSRSRLVGLARYVLTFRWAHTLSELTGYLSAVALLLATASVMHAVASRYLFGHPTVWQTELSVYLLMFVTFVGAAYGLKHHAHVGVDLVVERLPARLQLTVRIITALLALGVVLVVAWTMTPLWWEAYQEGFRSPTAWRAPLSVVYAILPLGMLLVACQYLALIVDGVLSLLGRRRAEVAALLIQQSPELAALEEKADDKLGNGSTG